MHGNESQRVRLARLTFLRGHAARSTIFIFRKILISEGQLFKSSFEGNGVDASAIMMGCNAFTYAETPFKIKKLYRRLGRPKHGEPQIAQQIRDLVRDTAAFIFHIFATMVWPTPLSLTTRQRSGGVPTARVAPVRQSVPVGAAARAPPSAAKRALRAAYQGHNRPNHDKKTNRNCSSLFNNFSLPTMA